MFSRVNVSELEEIEAEKWKLRDLKELPQGKIAAFI